jgi:hypothetical protein
VSAIEHTAADLDRAVVAARVAAEGLQSVAQHAIDLLDEIETATITHEALGHAATGLEAHVLRSAHSTLALLEAVAALAAIANVRRAFDTGDTGGTEGGEESEPVK